MADLNVTPPSPESSSLAGQPMPLPVAAAPAAPPSGGGPPPDVDPTAALNALATSGTTPKFNIMSDAMQRAGIIGIPKKPDGTPEPMGWAKSLVGGVQSALADQARPQGKVGAVGSVIGKMLSGLGNSYDPNGAPGLLKGLQQGVHGQMEAAQAAKDRQAKAAQQAIENADEKTKMEALQAHTNIEMHTEQRVAHQAGEKAALDSVSAGKADWDYQLSQPDAPPVLVPEITYAGMIEQMKQGKLTELQKKNALPIDRRPTGEVDADGNPQYVTYYGILGVPKDMPVGDNAADIEKYTGQKLDPATILPGATYNYLIGQVARGRTSEAAKNKAREEAGLEAEQTEGNALVRSHEWLNVLSNTPNLNPVKALETFVHNKTLSDKWPNAINEVQNYYGGKDGQKGWQELVKLGQKDTDKTADALDKLADDPVKLADPGTEAMLQGRINDPNTDPKLLPQLRRMQGTAKAAGIAKANAAATEAKAKQTVEDQGTIDGTAENLVEGREDPTQLNKRGKEYDATIVAADKYSMDKYGRHWNPAQAQNEFKYAGSIPVINTLNYLDSVKPNMDQLVAQSDKFKRTSFPKLNDVEAWTKLETGNPEIAAYRATILETADQVAKILQGGGTGGGTSDAKLRQAQDLFSVGFTAPQISAIANDLNGLLAHRGASMVNSNRYLRDKYPQYVTTPDPLSVPATGADRAENPHGPAPVVPKVQPGVTNLRQGPGGHQIGVLNGIWVDAGTGLPLPARKQ